MEQKYASLNTLQALINKLKTVFAPMSHTHTLADLANFETEISGHSFISTADIDEICDASISSASEVTF